MEKKYINTTEFFKESRLHPVVKLLLHCREELEYAKSIKGDVEKGTVSINMPVTGAFRLVDRLWRTFVYGGLSFDKLVFSPHYCSSKNEAPVNYVSILLQVNEQLEENKLQILIKRR